MSGVWTFERRAIEAVIEGVTPMLVRFTGKGASFVLDDGEDLLLFGVSRGFGSCSGESFHGMNVLGFVERWRVVAERQEEIARRIDWREATKAGHSVLFGEATVVEILEFTQAHGGDGKCLMAVELLRLQRMDRQTAVFAQTGKRSTYVVTV